MSESEGIDRVWQIIEKVGVCMLTTQSEGGLRARPLEARPDREAGLIFFVTDVHSPKEDEIASAPDVGIVFIDPKDKAYLSITARASVLRDVEKTKAIWRKTDEVWWPNGPSSADVSLLQIEPITAELWDGPASEAVAAFEFEGESDRAEAEARPESQDDHRDVSERSIDAGELAFSKVTLGARTMILCCWKSASNRRRKLVHQDWCSFSVGTSNTMISSRTVLSPSRVVPWAGERVNAVTPPKRSVSFSRSPENLSESNGRPCLSFRGRSISTRCISFRTAAFRT